jgi:hypothetical protein
MNNPMRYTDPTGYDNKGGGGSGGGGSGGIDARGSEQGGSYFSMDPDDMCIGNSTASGSTSETVELNDPNKTTDSSGLVPAASDSPLGSGGASGSSGTGGEGGLKMAGGAMGASGAEVFPKATLGVPQLQFDSDRKLLIAALTYTITYANNLNLLIGAGGLILTFTPLAPAGATILATTTAVGLGLGLAEAGLTQSTSKAVSTVAEAASGFGAGRLALLYEGYQETRFLWTAMRYQSVESGRFVTNLAGQNALMISSGAEFAADILFRSFDQ